MENANVYLIPHADATYHACITQTPPSQEAIFLVKEGTYPAEMYYHRYDIMGDRIVGRDLCMSRNDLIASLNWHGSCLHRIVSLWDLEQQPCNDKLTALFASAYAKRCEFAPPSEDLI